MNKGVDKVRKSIEQRKKMRQTTSGQDQSRRVYPLFPMEEEKHGYYPDFTNDDESAGQSSRLPLKQLTIKGILAVSLFVGTAFVMETNGEMFSLPKKWTSQAMTEEFPFARVHEWYQESFGSPMAVSPEEQVSKEQEALALPVSGTVTESFHANGTGIMISPEADTEVTALRDGIVIFAGKDDDTENTVIIQHADGSKSTYGYLDNLDVHLYQSIGTGQQLGNFEPTEANDTIYFAIEKDNDYIDPVQVIKVDEPS